MCSSDLYICQALDHGEDGAAEEDSLFLSLSHVVVYISSSTHLFLTRSLQILWIFFFFRPREYILSLFLSFAGWRSLAAGATLTQTRKARARARTPLLCSTTTSLSLSLFCTRGLLPTATHTDTHTVCLYQQWWWQLTCILFFSEEEEEEEVEESSASSSTGSIVKLASIDRYPLPLCLAVAATSPRRHIGTPDRIRALSLCPSLSLSVRRHLRRFIRKREHSHHPTVCMCVLQYISLSLLVYAPLRRLGGCTCVCV